MPEGAVVAAAIKARDTGRAQALLEKQPELIHTADERGNQPIYWAVMTRQIGLTGVWTGESPVPPWLADDSEY